MIPSATLAEVLVEVADTLVGDFDLVEFLHNLTVRTADLSGADAVGLVLADRHDTLQLMAASNESGRFLELLQLQSAQGPCRDCFTTQRPVLNVVLAATDAWPRFAPRAIEAGFRSVHAFPMRLRGTAVGALTLFSRSESAFADHEVAAVQAVADVATIAILQQRSVARATTTASQLQSALRSRVQIEQAKGALAQTAGITPDEAFTVLRDRARASQRRLGDVAADVIADLVRGS